MKRRSGWGCVLGLGLMVSWGLVACGGKREVTPSAVGSPDPAKSSSVSAGESGGMQKGGHTDHGHEHGAADHGHGEAGHAHGSPHGGLVVEAGRYHLEGVPTKVGLLVFLLDAQEKELPLTGVKGTMTFVGEGKPPVEVALEAMGNHLHAHVTLEGRWSAAVSLDKGGEKLVARFEGEGASLGKGHEHAAPDGAHDHGANGHSDSHGAGHHEHLALSEDVTLELMASGPIEVGKPIAYTLRYLDKERRVVTDFEVAHEEKLHLFFVSDDLAQYHHVHPVLDPNTGTFTLTQTLEVAGPYSVYSDFKSTRLGATLVRTALTVPGATPEKVPLVVDTVMKRTLDGGLSVALQTTPSPLAAQGDVMLTYTLAAQDGTPITDVEPYLGAMGHLFILHEDLVTLAHSHPRGAEPTPESRGGPSIEFHTVLPKPGRYKAWMQFQRAGVVHTVPWVLDAR